MIVDHDDWTMRVFAGIVSWRELLNSSVEQEFETEAENTPSEFSCRVIFMNTYIVPNQPEIMKRSNQFIRRLGVASDDNMYRSI